MSEELLLTAYERGWNAHDPDVCAGCFTRDAVRRSLLRDGPAATEGRTAIQEGIAMAMDALPDLVVEVLSLGNKRHDRTVKVGWYRQHGVRECWLVDPIARLVTLLDHTAARDFEDNERVRSAVLPRLRLRSSDIF